MAVRRWAMCVGALCAVSLPVGAGQKGGSLFPTGKGSRWVFKGSAAGQPIDMDATISASSKAGGKTTAVFRWNLNGKPVQDESYVVTAASVSRVKSGPYGSNEITPPLPVIMNPIAVGKSWTWKGSIKMAGGQTFPGEATLKVGARETIKSAAGSFNAFRVDMDLTVAAQGQTIKVPNSYWFAPGAGLVRQKVTLGTAVVEATVTKVQVK